MVKKSFEDKYHLLLEKVSVLEQGNISLEESIKIYEEAMKISFECKKMLEEAQKKIELINSQEQIDA